MLNMPQKISHPFVFETHSINVYCIIIKHYLIETKSSFKRLYQIEVHLRIIMSVGYLLL